MRVVEPVTKLIAYSSAYTPVTNPRQNAVVTPVLAPIFYAPLTHTLEATTGTDPTFTRATAATFEDFEGVIRTVESSEPRFPGARRVENLLSYSEDFGNA